MGTVSGQDPGDMLASGKTRYQQQQRKGWMVMVMEMQMHGS
jgi:hypothetical protein